MREIKFRFWNKELEKYNFLNLHDLGECNEYWYDGETAVWDVLYDSTHEQKRFIVEQYTGFKDKNGVEIYEGDVLNLENYSAVVRFIGNEEIYSFELCNKYSAENFYFIQNAFREYEVIGNIYENPELLKEQTK